MHVSLAVDAIEKAFFQECVANPTPFRNAGYGAMVIQHRFSDLLDQGHGDEAAAREKAILLAAAALRFLVDLCPNPPDEK